MKKTLICCCLTILLCSPALALEVLHCSDTDAIGFQWKGGKPNATRYVPLSFVIKIISKTERVIDAPSPDYNSDTYRCRQMDKPKGLFACTRPDSLTSFPINFMGSRYERVGNMSAQVGGMPDLYVAYGKCVPF